MLWECGTEMSFWSLRSRNFETKALQCSPTLDVLGSISMSDEEPFSWVLWNGLYSPVRILSKNPCNIRAAALGSWKTGTRGMLKCAGFNFWNWNHKQLPKHGLQSILHLWYRALGSQGTCVKVPTFHWCPDKKTECEHMFRMSRSKQSYGFWTSAFDQVCQVGIIWSSIGFWSLEGNKRAKCFWLS